MHLLGECHLVNHCAVLAQQDGRTACVGIAREGCHLHEVVRRAVVLLAYNFAVGGKQNITFGQEQTAVSRDFLQGRIGRIGKALLDDAEHQSAEVEGLVSVVVKFHIVHAW